MNGLFEAMMKKVVRGEGPLTEPETQPFEPTFEDWEGEFVAYLIKERDKGIYSQEQGARAFIVRKASEIVDAETIIELGRFNAKTSTAFMTAKEMFAEQVKAWMEGE